MIRIRALAIALPLLTAAGAALACTAVDMIAADKSVIAGRTMEWAFDMKWTLVSQPKGTALSLIAPKSTGLPARAVVTNPRPPLPHMALERCSPPRLPEPQSALLRTSPGLPPVFLPIVLPLSAPRRGPHEFEQPRPRADW